MSILTAEKLVELAYKYPVFAENWYLIASVSISVANRKEEVAKVLHFAIRQQLLDNLKASEKLVGDANLIKLAEASIKAVEADPKANELYIPDSLVKELPLPVKYTSKDEIHKVQFKVAQRIREALLKTAPIGSLPKAIACLWDLYPKTPESIRAPKESARPEMVPPTKEGNIDTINGKVGVKSVNPQQLVDTQVRGSEFYSALYAEKAKGGAERIFNAYPDLWRFTLDHVYADILSFPEILNTKETSFSVVSAIVPQDVPEILVGHTAGLVNAGSSKEEVKAIHATLVKICGWAGTVQWKGGQKSVDELFAPHE